MNLILRFNLDNPFLTITRTHQIVKQICIIKVFNSKQDNILYIIYSIYIHL